MSEQASTEAPPAIQCRVCWHERIAGRLYQFSGRVQDFKGAVAEVALKRGAYNFHGVYIECRAASDTAWPRAWDGPSVPEYPATPEAAHE